MTPTPPNRPSAGRYLFFGIGLLGLYVLVAMMFNDFKLPAGANYLVPRGVDDYLGVHRKVLRDLAPMGTWTILAKMLLLVPSAAALALFAARSLSERTVKGVAGRLAGIKERPLLVGGVVLMVLLLVFWSQVVFRQLPVYDDELTYRFQARTMLAGELAAPAPPCPDCFRNTFIIHRDGVWAGKYTSGHPAVLALSWLLGSPYILPILLAAVTPWLVFLIALEMGYERRTARLAALLFLISPLYLMVSGTLMNHGTCLFFLALFTLGFLRSRAGAGWWWPVVAGLALGVAFNIRPQTVVGFGVPFAVWAVARLVRSRGAAFLGRYLVMALAFVPPVGYALYYNHVVTGDWFTFPFMLLESDGPTLAEFFALGDPVGGKHTIWKGVFFGLINFWRMNAYLFGWGFSLVFVFAFFLMRQAQVRDRLWLGVMGCLAAFYLWFASPGLLELGPRYYFPMLIPLLIWSAQGMLALHDFLGARLAGSGLQGRVLVPAFVVISVLMGLGTFTREHIQRSRLQTSRFATPYEYVARAGIHNAIVVVDGLPHAGWVFGLRNPDPRLEENDIIYVWNNTEDKLRILANSFPRRAFYYLKFTEEDGEPVGRLERLDNR